jgi:hypothetical protein
MTHVGQNPPALSLDWQLSTAASTEFYFGYSSLSSDSSLLLGARLSRKLYIEDNLDHFLFLGGGLLTRGTADNSNTGVLLESGLGSRFFLAGLPNLGLSIAGGLRFQTPGQTTLTTHFFAGFHYYF